MLCSAQYLQQETALCSKHLQFLMDMVCLPARHKVLHLLGLKASIQKILPDNLCAFVHFVASHAGLSCFLTLFYGDNV